MAEAAPKNPPIRTPNSLKCLEFSIFFSGESDVKGRGTWEKHSFFSKLTRQDNARYFPKGMRGRALRSSIMPQIKGKRVVVTLECTEARAQGLPPSRYMTTKNKSKQSGRIEKKKYNPFLRKHTLHREVK
jgi:large subunit ribosomal protein L33